MSDADAALNQPTPSAGALLRQSREAAGLHIAALAVSLKMPVRKIEALEADRLEDFPNAAFARALASSICRALKVDSAPVLAALPFSPVPVLPVIPDSKTHGTLEPAYTGARGAWIAHVSRPAPILGAILVAGSLAMWLAPDWRSDEPLASVPKAASTTPVAQELAVAAVAEVPKSAAQIEGKPIVEQTTPIAQNMAQNMSQKPQLSTMGTEFQQSGSAGVVQFSATGTSWIEVVDAKGVVQLRRTLNPGESAQASGVSPLQIVIGHASATLVRVHGSPFHVPAVSRDDVARFEVKW